ncbi:MAG: hypothetical protein KAT90_13680 [Gammaproteobacteria bacterium]|nr:hypothetical protein [Gammaproteobacteria bacterium]
MTKYQDKAMASALIVSTLIVTLNIIAVTTGAADGFYAAVQNWISSTL